MLWPRLARALIGRPLTDAAPAVPQPTVAALAERLATMARTRLGRSLAIREVDSGSCNGCELEVNALQNVAYDLERFGLRFVASPKHADVLLVTGDEDVVAPPQSVRMIGDRIRGSRVETLRGCGHWTPIEMPGEACNSPAGCSATDTASFALSKRIGMLL